MWKAGTASTVITPTEPLWLAGYANRSEPARGKVSDLHVKALALEDDAGQRFLILTLDLIAANSLITGDVLQALKHKHGLDERSVLFASSHTHYGPEIRPDKAFFFDIPEPFAKKIPETAERVREALLSVADLALASMQPARLYIRQTKASFADNRRSAGGVTDHHVPIVEVVSHDGATRAVLFGYACHNTTIPPEDARYCADWAGFAQAQIERDHPGATALFITGAAADQNPTPRGSVELSRQHGAELASAIAQSLRTTGVEITGPLRAAYETIPLPLQTLSREELQQRAASDDPPVARKAKFLLRELASGQPLIAEYPVPLQVVRLGDQLLLIALPGEPVNDYAHLLKTGTQSVFAGAKTDCVPVLWVAGYCNDMFGYLPTRRIQSEGGYEAKRANLWSSIPAPFDDSVEDRITNAIARLIEKVV